VTLADYDKMFDAVEGCTAIIMGQEVIDHLWSLLAPQARYVETGCPVKYPTFNGVDIIPDTRNQQRFEAVY
jgi:hypothetical protein